MHLQQRWVRSAATRSTGVPITASASMPLVPLGGLRHAVRLKTSKPRRPLKDSAFLVSEHPEHVGPG